MLIRWKAPSHHHRRVLSKADFAGIDAAKGGPFEQEPVVWEESNDWVADVADDVAEYLLVYEEGFAKPTPKQEEAAEERAAYEEPEPKSKKK
jgi:hypothetical protein